MALHKCDMCYFESASKDFLLRHVIKYHKHDPKFKIRCNTNGCESTFVKWKSYKQHVLRKHPTNGVENRETIETYENAIPSDEAVDTEAFTFERFEFIQAQFLIQIREHDKISDVSISHIIEGVRNFWTHFSNLLMNELQKKADPVTKHVNFEDVRKCFTETFSPERMFFNVDSRYKLDKFLVDKMNMIMPEKIVMGTEMVWKKRKSRQQGADLVEIEQTGFIVPLLKSLKVLLCNKDVKKCVDNPRLDRNDEILRNVLDGSHYQTHDFFRENRNALAIILYYDDLEIASPLGSKTSVHKLSMFYWSLANIYPELRSSARVINLFAIVKTQLLKKFGVDKILEQFAQEINVLQTEGITIAVDGREFTYKGSLLFVSGDTPASALIGGFKESVAAYRFCRTCLTTSNQWRNAFCESNFTLRSKEIHSEQVNNIYENHLGNQALEYWKKKYGMNRKSALLDINGFDVTTCLPQDAMHILAEGIVEIATRVFLKYCICEQSVFTINTLNDCISRFNYGHLQKNAPSAISQSHLLDGHLRQSSSQMLTLAHTLPFLVGQYVYDNNDADLIERFECHGRLLQIINVILSYEIHEESIATLERMITVYTVIFNRLYPNSIVPKFHFLIHIPRYIRLFGPARQQWCFRFEAAHSYFKSLVPVVRNFKNIPKTLAYRHQALMCSWLYAESNTFSTKFLYAGHEIFSGETTILENLPIADLFYTYFDEDEISRSEIFRTNGIKVYGTLYRAKSLILIADEENSLPLFGEIQEVYILKDIIFFVFHALRTIRYSDTFNAYEIEEIQPKLRKVMRLQELTFSHPLLHVKFGDERYVVLLDNCRTEFFG